MCGQLSQMTMRYFRKILRFTKKPVIRVYHLFTRLLAHFRPGAVYARWHKKHYLESKLPGMTPQEQYDLVSEYHRTYDKDGKKYHISYHNTVAVRDIVLAQLANYNNIDFRFADLAVRLCALEDYFHGKADGMELYSRMQYQLGAKFDWAERFKQAIQSCEEKGFDNTKIIQLDRRMAVLDGMHRLSYAFYKGMDLVAVDIFEQESQRFVDPLWFWENNFEESDCLRIQNTVTKMLARAKYQYWGIIWPSAMNVAAELIQTLNKFGEDNAVSVANIFDVEMSYWEFVFFLKRCIGMIACLKLE